MKNLLQTVFVTITMTFALVFLGGCADPEIKKVSDKTLEIAADGMQYFQDKKTGYCYAILFFNSGEGNDADGVSGVGMTKVDCGYPVSEHLVGHGFKKLPE